MEVNYKFIAQRLVALTDGVPYEISNLANASALLWQHLPDINWAGFYKLEQDLLILGPFQGKAACVRIALGVLDIDSPTVGRFTPADLAGLEQVAQVVEGFLLP